MTATVVGMVAGEAVATTSDGRVWVLSRSYSREEARQLAALIRQAAGEPA